MEFSDKYHEDTFPERYAGKHRASIARRLNDSREKRLLTRALACIEPADSLIDVGCGPGRLWPVLTQTDASLLFGLDVSHSMLSFAAAQPNGDRFFTSAGSVTALPFADATFDCVIANRLLHHFGAPEVRGLAISELRRVAAKNVIVSLWVDGNFKAWRRRSLEHGRTGRYYENRHVLEREQLAREFADAGLRIVRHFDLLPRYSQWRYYVLSCE